jgi:hypothetical protein
MEREWPTYVAWWAPDEATPTRTEGAKRLEHLHDHGPTPYAFDFEGHFDTDSNPLRMDREKIQECSKIIESQLESLLPQRSRAKGSS